MTRVAVVTVAHGRHEHLLLQSAGLDRSQVRPDLRVVVAIDDPAAAGVTSPMIAPVLDIDRPSPHVARVWLARPELRNAFNAETIAALTAGFRELAADNGLRAIVLGGQGKAFCAGADLGWMREMAG